jgi:hypothetical protein
VWLGFLFSVKSVSGKGNIYMNIKNKRRDYGKLRLSTKDLVGLDWVATMGTVRLDALSQLFSLVEGREFGLEATRKLVHRWLVVGWAEQQAFLSGVPPFIWLTKSGMAQTRYSLPTEIPALALLQHTSDMSFIRLEAIKALPSAVWRSEREIRNVASQHSKGVAYPHLPDGEVLVEGAYIVGIERERTAKTIERTRSIMLELCTRKNDYDNSMSSQDLDEYRYSEIYYYASNEALKVVEKAKGQIPENFANKVKVIAW